MMTSQILKSVDFTQIQKSRYPEHKIFFLFKTIITHLLLKIVLQQRQPLNTTEHLFRQQDYPIFLLILILSPSLSHI